MKTLAKLDENGVVQNIIVANDDWDTNGFVEYTESNPAYIGGLYINGKFIPPKPGENAIFNEQTGAWEVPSQIDFLANLLINADTIK
jgi:hypothetical protein